jgi:folylpolyglutamate synthase/dihydropteroate synthase
LRIDNAAHSLDEQLPRQFQQCLKNCGGAVCLARGASADLHREGSMLEIEVSTVADQGLFEQLAYTLETGLGGRLDGLDERY